MLFANPCRGPLHVSKLAIDSLVPASAYGKVTSYWTRPSGNTDFAVTQFFGPCNVAGEWKIVWPGGEGIAAGTYPLFHIGFDIGNARCGDPILAMAAGKVTLVSRDNLGALVITIDHGLHDGHTYTTTYRHEATQVVKLGQIVAESQQIATVGKTGAQQCHGHIEGRKNGALIDLYRRLKQNTSVDPDVPVVAPEAEMILTKNLQGYTGTVAVPYKIRKAPSLTGEVIRVLASTETWSLLGMVKGDLANGSDQWYVRLNGLTFEFVHSGGILPPLLSPVPGATPAEVGAKVIAAKQEQWDIDSTHIVVAPVVASLGNPRP